MNNIRIEKLNKGDYKMKFEELAKKVGIKSYTNISEVLGGRRIGNTEFFQKVGKALGMTENEIDSLILEAKEAELENYKRELREKKGVIFGPVITGTSNEQVLNELEKIKKMLEEK